MDLSSNVELWELLGKLYRGVNQECNYAKVRKFVVNSDNSQLLLNGEFQRIHHQKRIWDIVRKEFYCSEILISLDDTITVTPRVGALVFDQRSSFCVSKPLETNEGMPVLKVSSCNQDRKIELLKGQWQPMAIPRNMMVFASQAFPTCHYVYLYNDYFRDLWLEYGYTNPSTQEVFTDKVRYKDLEEGKEIIESIVKLLGKAWYTFNDVLIVSSIKVTGSPLDVDLHAFVKPSESEPNEYSLLIVRPEKEKEGTP